MKVFALGVLAACLAITPGGFAAEVQYEVTVKTGAVARESAPVRVELPASAAKAFAGQADLSAVPAQFERDAVGTVPAQIVKEGEKYFALFTTGENEKAGQTFRGTLRTGMAQRRAVQIPRFSIEPGGTDHEDLVFGSGVKVWRYMTTPYDPAKDEETYKVYHQIFDFDGKGFVTKGPGGKYTHHRGLFVGWRKTTVGGAEIDTWHMKPVGTIQKHTGFKESDTLTGAVAGRRTAIVDWLDPKGKLVIEDERTLTAWRQPQGRTLLDADLLIQSKAGDIKLDGDPQHAGFQFRAAQEVADNEKDTVYVLPAGSARDKEDVMKGSWATAIFKIQGHPRAVMFMAHPSNRHRDTAVFSARLYARFGEFFATELKEGDPLKMKYRILVLDAEKAGAITTERCQAIYDDYVNPVVAEAKDVAAK